MKPPLKVTVIWHAGMLPGYLPFFSHLGALPGVKLSLIMPPAWDTAGYRYKTPLSLPEADLARIRPWFRFRVSTLVYPGLGKVLDAQAPDLIFLIQEPTHLACLQAARWIRRKSPATRLIFQTAQNLVQVPGWPWSWVQDAVFKASDGAVAVTREVAEVLGKFGYQKPVGVLPLWVDARQFKARPAKRSGPTFHIGYVGRLAEEKGVDTLLKGLSRLKFGFKAELIGDGPQAGYLKQLATGLGLQDRVRFRGALSQGALAKAYRSMDCLVVPSLTRPWWKEQFGRVLVEAMACGLPCLGSGSGSIPEVMGDAGLVFPEGDDQAISRLLGRLRNSPLLARRLGARALKRSVMFSIPAVAREHLKFYRDIVKGKP